MISEKYTPFSQKHLLTGTNSEVGANELTMFGVVFSLLLLAA